MEIIYNNTLGWVSVSDIHTECDPQCDFQNILAENDDESVLLMQ